MCEVITYLIYSYINSPPPSSPCPLYFPRNPFFSFPFFPPFGLLTPPFFHDPSFSFLPHVLRQHAASLSTSTGCAAPRICCGGWAWASNPNPRSANLTRRRRRPPRARARPLVHTYMRFREGAADEVGAGSGAAAPSFVQTPPSAARAGGREDTRRRRRRRPAASFTTPPHPSYCSAAPPRLALAAWRTSAGHETAATVVLGGSRPRPRLQVRRSLSVSQLARRRPASQVDERPRGGRGAREVEGRDPLDHPPRSILQHHAVEIRMRGAATEAGRDTRAVTVTVGRTGGRGGGGGGGGGVLRDEGVEARLPPPRHVMIMDEHYLSRGALRRGRRRYRTWRRL
ncbi:hypothetical protein F5X96DRAFT_638438 [Biscogniauxia mediterranea]|nr:hypothetical protein F5X96DRAFT_638438 [Biscogniauxia mediterranea]